MKRLVIAALAIGAMAACTKSNVQYEQPGEISLQPVTQKATKAAVDGTVYPTDEAYNFNVWAWWADENAGTALADFDTNVTDYITKGTFVYRNNGSWGGYTPYYWPTKGSLVFAGYSPANAKVEGQDAPVFHYDLPTKTFSVSNYIQSNNIAATKDLMWFDVTGVSYDQNGAENKGVPVVFKHALSWLTFKFNLKDEDTDKMWKVTNVKLTGIETMADCVIERGKNPVWDNRTVYNDAGLSDEEKVLARTMQIYNGSKEIEYESGATWTNGNTTVTDFGGTALESTPNGVLVIPQSCAQTDASIVITYDMKTYVGNGVLTGQTVELPLEGDQIDDNKWEPGKHYIYTITFGANEILIAPTVTVWDTVEVDPINVQ